MTDAGVAARRTAEWPVASVPHGGAATAGTRGRRGAVLRSRQALGVSGPRLSPCPDTPSFLVRVVGHRRGARCLRRSPSLGAVLDPRGLHGSRHARTRRVRLRSSTDESVGDRRRHVAAAPTVDPGPVLVQDGIGAGQPAALHGDHRRRLGIARQRVGSCVHRRSRRGRFRQGRHAGHAGPVDRGKSGREPAVLRALG